MPSPVTGKASPFPALHQAMHAHKQQHLPVQRAFFYALDGSRDVGGVPMTGNLQLRRSSETTEQPGLPKPCLSQWELLRLGCRGSHLKFWSRYNLSYVLKKKKIFCGTKVHLNLFKQYKWKIVYSLKIQPTHQSL